MNHLGRQDRRHAPQTLNQRQGPSSSSNDIVPARLPASFVLSLPLHVLQYRVRASTHTLKTGVGEKQARQQQTAIYTRKSARSRTQVKIPQRKGGHGRHTHAFGCRIAMPRYPQASRCRPAARLAGVDLLLSFPPSARLYKPSPRLET